MEKIEKIVELDIDDDLFIDDTDDTGVDIVSLVDAPAINVDFHYFSEEIKLESYTDYPEGAKNNACRALKYAEENGWGSCGQSEGKLRANTICKGEPVSEDMLGRIASFKRHEQHKDVPYTEGCGGLMWDAWGGSSMINWASSKLKELELKKCKGKTCKHEYEVLSDDAQTEILNFCNDDKNGYYIEQDDVYLDFTKTSFGVGDVIKSIVGLDILERLIIRKDEPAEVYWRYSGPPAQRDFCKAMMNLAKRGKIFTQAELDKMDSLNAQFAQRGSSSYDKMAWKGGTSCTHYWQKLNVFKNSQGNKVIIATSDAKNTREDNAMKSNNKNQPGPLGSVPNNASVNYKDSFSFSLNEEKRMVTGPLMIPNKMILRRTASGEPFYIFFSRDTIRKMAEKFFRTNKNNNTDINHDENVVTKNTLVESWISESMKHDKSYKYGYMLPPGTWFVTYKINDDETWAKIKSGELKGFSLAGGFITKMKPVDPEKTLNDIKDILNKVK